MGSEVESAALRTRLAALRALADAATPGNFQEPWHVRDGGPTGAVIMNAELRTVAIDVRPDRAVRIVACVNACAHMAADPGFEIARARTALPELAGLLEKALDVVDEARRYFKYLDEADKFLEGTFAGYEHPPQDTAETIMRERVAAFDAAAEKLEAK